MSTHRGALASATGSGRFQPGDGPLAGPGEGAKEMAKAKKPASPKPKPKPAKAPRAPRGPGIEKRYLKSRPACKVTFVLPGEAAPAARTVCLMGEFNDWSPEAHPLRRLKDGSYAVTVELDTGRAYRFRYIIDGERYENHWCADRYEPNLYGGEDSVVDV